MTQAVASECGAGLYPQNSLAGFTYCLDNQIPGIEFDVHLSRDGHVVVHHDYLLNKRIARDPGGQWLAQTGPPLCTMSLEELARFDIGRYAPGSREEKGHPDYQPQDGERLPTFTSFLAAHEQRSSPALLWVELKTTPFRRDISSDPMQLVEQVIADLTTHNLADQAILLAFEWDLLVAAKKLCPAIQTDFLTINPAYIADLYKADGNVDPALMYGAHDPVRHGGSLSRAISAAGGDWWGPLASDIGADDVIEAQSQGVRVNVWGVASSNTAIEQALAFGADALTLNRPDLLLSYLQAIPAV